MVRLDSLKKKADYIVLPKKFRLPTRTEITSLHQKGKTIHTPLFTIIAKESDNSTRFGFIVSNKIDNRAVKRNRLKRKLRAATWNILQKKNYVGDFLIIAKRESLISTENQIEKLLEKILENQTIKK